MERPDARGNSRIGTGNCRFRHRPDECQGTRKDFNRINPDDGASRICSLNRSCTPCAFNISPELVAKIDVENSGHRSTSETDWQNDTLINERLSTYKRT